VLIAMAFQSWEQVYEDASLDQIVTPAARPLVARIARNCLYGQGQLVASVPSAVLLGLTFLSAPPWETEPWKAIAAENNPGGTPIGVPILIVQGGADGIVTPEVTERLVEALCSRGEQVDLRLLPGVGHVATGHEAAADVAAWIADRFAGAPAPNTCS
jgi:pimeloyl-ACP methyl ester carboxylesterase